MANSNPCSINGLKLSAVGFSYFKGSFYIFFITRFTSSLDIIIFPNSFNRDGMAEKLALCN
jgi:hypothetical protein